MAVQELKSLLDQSVACGSSPPALVLWMAGPPFIELGRLRHSLSLKVWHICALERGVIGVGVIKQTPFPGWPADLLGLAKVRLAHPELNSGRHQRLEVGWYGTRRANVYTTRELPGRWGVVEHNVSKHFRVACKFHKHQQQRWEWDFNF